MVSKFTPSAKGLQPKMSHHQQGLDSAGGGCGCMSTSVCVCVCVCVCERKREGMTERV